MKTTLRACLSILFRGIATALLFCAACFAVFGFLESFEPPNGLGWQAGYALFGTASLLGIAAMWIRDQPAANLGKVFLLAASTFSMLALRPSYASNRNDLFIVYTSIGIFSLTGAIVLWRKGRETSKVSCFGRFGSYVLFFALFGLFSIKFDLRAV